MNLQTVTQAVAEHLADGTAPDSPPEQAPGELRHAYQMATLGMVMFFFGVVIGCTGIALHEDGVKMAGALVAIAGIILPFYWRLSIARLQSPRSKSSAQQALPPSVDTNRALPPERFAEAVSSVTEQTTDLLDLRISERKRSGELSG
jgi:hypothetical protein